jgi:hypothetical protein
LHSLSSVVGLTFSAGTRIEAHGLPADREAILRDSLWICKPEVGKWALVAVERVLARVKRLIRSPDFRCLSLAGMSASRLPQFPGYHAILNFKDFMNPS